MPAATPTLPYRRAELLLKFSNPHWQSVRIQNAIVRKIAEIGYGYRTDSGRERESESFVFMVRGWINIAMEVWSNQPEYEVGFATGALVDLGKSLADHWQSAFIIPQYTKDANPGLVSVEDLKKPEYKQLFVTPGSDGKARALGCVIFPDVSKPQTLWGRWLCAEYNEEKIAAYGLTEFVQTHNPGSHAELDAEIITAYEKGEDVLFYYYGPTKLTDRLEREFGGYYILEEPEYTDACWAADKGCAYATEEVHIAVHPVLLEGDPKQEAAPDIVELLRNWHITGPLLIAAVNYQDDTGASDDEVATWWLRNTEEWKSWVAPGVAEKVLAGLENSA